MFGGVPKGVLLEQNEGPEDLLFFDVPRGVFWGPFGVVLGSNINENRVKRKTKSNRFENNMKFEWLSCM